MPRPKKEAGKRDRRLTLYLTDIEDAAVREAADVRRIPVTQLILHAVRDWMDRLADPPVVLRQARIEAVMVDDEDTVQGYVCPRGHVWWIRDWEAVPNRCCPICGAERDIQRTWNGRVVRRKSTGK